MRTIAYALSVATTVMFSIFIFPLAWMIPMTIMTKKTINDGKQHLVLGICHIFLMGGFGLVSGILILISEEQVQSKKIKIKNKSEDDQDNR